MKVLEKGRSQKGWAKEYNCTGNGNGNGGCGAKLLVEEDDLFLTHNYDYGGGHDIYITFKCPECGVKTDVPDVPSSIRIKVNKEDPDKVKRKVK